MQAAQSIIRRFIEQALNQGNLTLVDELFAVDVANHMGSWGIPTNRRGLKQLIANLHSAFPDLQCTLEDEIGEGDKFAAHWTVRGTHKGSFIGNLPTGRSVEAQGFIFARTMDGRIVEDWIQIDQMGMLQQLGIVPPLQGRK